MATSYPELRNNDLDFNRCWEIYCAESERREARLAKGRPPLALIKTPPSHRITPEKAALQIEDIEMSVRAKNCLTRAGIKTLGELVQQTPEEIRKIRNLGQRAFGEIQYILDKLPDIVIGGKGGNPETRRKLDQIHIVRVPSLFELEEDHPLTENDPKEKSRRKTDKHE